MLNILAIDPGISNLGWSIVNYSKETNKWIVTSAGCIHADPARKGYLVAVENLRRAKEAFRAILAVAIQNRISCIVAELPSGGSKSARAGTAMASATALIGALAEVLGCVECYILPSGTRKALFKAKEVSKTQIEKYVINYFSHKLPVTGLKKHDEHIYDSLGAFLAASGREEIQKLVKDYLNGKDITPKKTETVSGSQYMEIRVTATSAKGD